MSKLLHCIGSTARVVADGVAYAPHLRIDVKSWLVEWYGFSIYKTWDPHMAALFGTHSAFTDLKVCLSALPFSSAFQLCPSCCPSAQSHRQ